MKKKNEKRSRVNGYTAEDARMLGIPVVNGIPQENAQGIDRWTSNGHGIRLGPISRERKAAVATIEAERNQNRDPKRR